MKKLVLCSGGFDSVTMVTAMCEKMKTNGENTPEITLLFFDYGQRNMVNENDCAYKLKEKYPEQIAAFCFQHIDLPEIDNISLSNGYIPMRNLIFLSYALAIAETYCYPEIYMALLKDGCYVDTTKKFMKSMQKLGKQVGVRIVFPFAKFYKEDIADGIAHPCEIQQYDFTSCDNTTAEGVPCGYCSKCNKIKQIYSV